MVKTKFKKAVSLMLAAVMSLTAFMGIGATTAFAAVGEKADVYLVDYPRSGDTNNNGEWGHGNLNYMNGWKGLSTKYTGLRAMGSYSGNIAYCIEPGTGQRTGDIPKYAGCVNGVQWFRDRGQWADGSYEPSPGTIIFFDWEGDGVTDHTGIVQKCENGTVYTVEGNSGDTCRTKTYPVGSSVIYGYGIPAY